MDSSTAANLAAHRKILARLKDEWENVRTSNMSQEIKGSVYWRMREIEAAIERMESGGR
jgi:hypothetical protein